jgi:hypothetical protein
MSAGPIIAGVGMLLMLRVGEDADYVTELLPALVVFGLGLSLVVAPLTAAVMAAVDDSHSGVASGVNNAISRVAGLLAIAVLGTFISAQFSSSLDEKLAGRPLDAAGRAAVETAKDRPLAVASPADSSPAERQALEAASRDASVDAFHLGMGISALITMGGGLIAAVGIVNPRRRIHAEQCPGGAICGAPESAGHPHPAAGAYSGKWQTASTLTPSGSSTKAP